MLTLFAGIVIALYSMTSDSTAGLWIGLAIAAISFVRLFKGFLKVGNVD